MLVSCHHGRTRQRFIKFKKIYRDESEEVDDDLAVPSDPYDDEIVPADCEALFGGDNDDGTSDNEDWCVNWCKYIMYYFIKINDASLTFFVF